MEGDGRGLFACLAGLVVAVSGAWAWNRAEMRRDGEGAAWLSEEPAQSAGRLPAGRTEAPRTALPGTEAAADSDDGDQEPSDPRALPLDEQRARIRTLFERLQSGEIDAPDAWYELREYDPESVVEAAREWWPRLQDPLVRADLAEEAGWDDEFPLIGEILDLAITDPIAEVRAQGAEFLSYFVYHDFAEDPEGYRRWRERAAGLDRRELVKLGLGRFLTGLRSIDPLSADFESLEVWDWEVQTEHGPVLGEIGGAGITWRSSSSAKTSPAISIFHGWLTHMYCGARSAPGWPCCLGIMRHLPMRTAMTRREAAIAGYVADNRCILRVVTRDCSCVLKWPSSSNKPRPRLLLKRQ